LLLLAFSTSLSSGEALLRLALAGALGGLIGLERELREREASIRTDPTRIAAQIVTGIGFLGAGAILRQGSSIRGLTTAATLWVVAAVGLASGAGYYSAALITTALVLLALWPLRVGAYLMLKRFRTEDGRLLVELPVGVKPGELVDEIEKAGARISAMEVSHEGDRRRLEVDVILPRTLAAPRLVTQVADVPEVADVRWSD
jgi:putative Mg2+ transporter-C (MgtC) family protein